MDVRGRARDLRTGASTGGAAEVLDASDIDASVAPDRRLTSVRGPDPGIDELVGRSTVRGFRSAVAAVLPHLDDSSSPLRLLLDDLPGALLVSGAAVLAFDPGRLAVDSGRLEAQVDVCAGWVDGGALVTATRAAGRAPMPATIPCPPLEAADDPIGWHDAPLPDPVATRRRRLLDVSVEGPHATRLRIEALFRDSLIGPDGVEQAFHEYAVEAVAERTGGMLTHIAATAGVLPWHECPGALASAGRLVGTAVAELRPRVRASFRGTSTCTHLNDVLAAVGDVEVLAAQLG